MKKNRITRADVSVSVYPSLILCTCITDDMQYIKMKYCGYTKAQAVKMFVQYVNSL